MFKGGGAAIVGRTRGYARTELLFSFWFSFKFSFWFKFSFSFSVFLLQAGSLRSYVFRLIRRGSRYRNWR